MNRELMEKCHQYLSIVDSMEGSEWYMNEFRKNPNWSLGLTQTVIALKKALDQQ
jgi:hypothetical protein